MLNGEMAMTPEMESVVTQYRRIANNVLWRKKNGDGLPVMDREQISKSISELEWQIRLLKNYIGL